MSHPKVPFFRPLIGQAEIDNVTECMRSGWLTTGPMTAAFESEFSNRMDGAECLAVTSATAALHLGLEALGVGPGDEVIVPTLTFTATAEVVRYMGADPVFVDMDLSTFCIDIDAIEAVITPRTKVIMPVHFAGRSCDLTALRAIADKHGLTILDDAAHALPTHHKGKLIGTTGADITAFSFYANKTMTTGEGGMLVTHNKELAARARVMRLHGIDRDVFNRFTDAKASWIYDVVAPGFKYNMTDVASAMGRAQFARIDEFRDMRFACVERYNQALKDLSLILPPGPADGDTHSWHLYIVQLTDDAPMNRNSFIDHLKSKDIGCSVHYRPLHQMTYWSKNFSVGASFPVADAYFERCVSLPLFMDMRKDEQDYVIGVIKAALS